MAKNISLQPPPNKKAVKGSDQFLRTCRGCNTTIKSKKGIQPDGYADRLCPDCEVEHASDFFRK
jgi:hypothetical protein